MGVNEHLGLVVGGWCYRLGFYNHTRWYITRVRDVLSGALFGFVLQCQVSKVIRKRVLAYLGNRLNEDIITKTEIKVPVRVQSQ